MGFGTMLAVPPSPRYRQLIPADPHRRLVLASIEGSWNVERFIVKVAQSPSGRSGHYAMPYDPMRYWIIVLELKPGTMRPPSSVRSKSVKRVLLRLGPLHTSSTESPGIVTFLRAERVVAALNSMNLALDAAELTGTKGMKKLVKYLWEMEE